jgi:plasmid stabilization system protein ParE
MVFKIVLTHKAQIDILEGIEWYNKHSADLGKRFYQTIQKEYKNLRQNPYFQVRYEDIRCLPLKKYPYMIHFVVEEEREQVVVLGIICTHRDPVVGEERANR